MDHKFVLAYAIGVGLSMFALTELLTMRPKHVGRISGKEWFGVTVCSLLVGWFLWPIYFYWVFFSNPFKSK